MSRPTKKEAIEKLNSLIQKIEGLTHVQHNHPDFTKWERATTIALRNIFGDKDKHVDEFTSISYSPMVFTMGSGNAPFDRAYSRGLQNAKALLESMVEEIKEYWSENEAPVTPKTAKPVATTSVSKNIFIIHGRDDGVKEAIARFVSDLDYVPIILHEQASEGRTVIEKFEANADVCFVIALLTPDDMGGLSGATELKPRARQNVVFEFGYFIGRLSRKRVCAITKGDVEIPSDYAGVVYIPMDSAGAWRMLLLREMKAADLNVDANNVI